MAKISQLPALNDPNGNELVPVVKDGKTMRASVSGLVAGAVAGTVDNLKVDAVAYIGRPGDVALVDGTPTGIGAVYWHDTVDDAGSVTAIDVFDRAAGTINFAVYRGPRNALVRVALTSFQTTGTRTSRRIALAEPVAVRAGDFLAVQPTAGALVVAEVQSGDVGYTYSSPYLPETIALDAPTTNGQVQVRFVIAYRKQVVTAETFLASTAVKITGPRAVALSSDVNPRGYVAWTTAGKPTGHLVKWGNYTATLDARAQRMEFPNFSLAQPYAFIGNSLTDSTDVTNRWSQVLSARYGQLMISVARYSSDWRMVYRVGAKEIVLTLAGALPAAGSVAVSKINGAAIDGNNPAAFLTTGDPGVVSGMAMSGYLTRNGITRRATVSAPNGASFAYVVTQAAGQTAITFDGPVTFVPDFALSVPGRICVIWLGNNYFFSGVANAYGDNTNPQMWVDLKLIVAFLQARGCRVLLLPVIPSANTAEGDNWLARGAGTPYTAMEAANARTEAMFPGLMAKHADGRTLLKFLQDRNDGSPEALDDVAKGFTPRNLRRRPDGSYDLLHMYGDGAGDLAVADFVDSALQAQALPNLVTQTTDFLITAIGGEGQLPDTAIARISRDTVGDLVDQMRYVSTASKPLIDARPQGYSKRAAVWALVDRTRRKLRYITAGGIGVSNIPERFAKDIQILGGVTAPINMTGNRLEAIGDPDSDDDAVSRGYSDGRYLRKNANLDMGGNTVGGLGAPVAPGDAVRLSDFRPVADKFPSTYTGKRTGVVWAILDSAKRRLRYIDPNGIGWSNIPERFNRAVQFLGGVTFSGRAGFAQMALGSANVDLLSSYGDRSGYIRAWVDTNRRVMFGLRKGGTVWAFGKRLATTDDLSSVAPSATYIPPLLRPVDAIAEAWGDSLTGATGGTAYGTQLAALIGGGFTVSINSYGGRESKHIAARMGATLTTVNATGGQIAGNGGTTAITNVSTNLLWMAGAGTQNERGRVIGIGAGVLGRLNGTTDGNGNTTYDFVSDAGQPTVVCPDGALFIPERRTSVTRERELWICVGRNNAGDFAQVLYDVAAMIGMARKTHKRIMLFGIINGNYTNEVKGGSGWAAIRKLNNELRRLYPNYYVVDSQGRDLRERLVASYDPNIPQDVIDFGNDIPPSSLRADNIHLVTAGYGVWAQLGYEFRQANIV